MSDDKDTPSVPEWVKHPGLGWTDDAACREKLFNEDGTISAESISLFFVDAGHILSEEVRAMCRTCPVRRECLIHSFTGNEGKVITAGYYAGFSYGQRKSTSFETLLGQVKDESDEYRLDAD